MGKPLNKLRAYDAIAKHTFKYACEQVIEKEFVLTLEQFIGPVLKQVFKQVFEQPLKHTFEQVLSQVVKQVLSKLWENM